MRPRIRPLDRNTFIGSNLNRATGDNFRAGGTFDRHHRDRTVADPQGRDRFRIRDRRSAEGRLARLHARPLIGLFFAAFYVVGGIILVLQLQRADQSYSIIPVALGFPLLAPFLAVGLYEVSRRLELRDANLQGGMGCHWCEIIGVVFRQKDRQIPSMAAVIIMIFLFWVFIAHMIFALFLGLMPMQNILTEWQHTIFLSTGSRCSASARSSGR